VKGIQKSWKWKEKKKIKRIRRKEKKTGTKEEVEERNREEILNKPRRHRQKKEGGVKEKGKRIVKRKQKIKQRKFLF